MLSSNVLDRCIDLLSTINSAISSSDSATREAIMELGYILKQEYNIVSKMENEGKVATENGNFTIKGLVADNTQLFKENEDLLKDNIKLKKIIESTMPNMAKKIQLLLEQLTSIN
jgi:pyocin large subunit-like protein